MKRNSIIFILLTMVFSACIKQNNKYHYNYYEPVYATKQSVRDAIQLEPARAINSMGGLIVYGNYILANDKEKGIHIIDVSIPSNPQKIGFIPIPGNQGLAVRNNYLYADCYMDMFVININNIQAPKLEAVKENVFQSRAYYYGFQQDADHIIVSWIEKDTVINTPYLSGRYGGGVFLTEDINFLSSYSGGTGSGGNSVGGSMAIFTLINSNLYAIDNYKLYTFDLQNPTSPNQTSVQNVNWNIETIFPFKDKLFIGSRNGMFIYAINNLASPTYISQFGHISSCDPVIANDHYALVTLRSGTACQGFTNELNVLDISDIQNPTFIKKYDMSNPHGLSLSGNVLFLCDGPAGVRVMDASNMKAITEKKVLNVGTAIDVITINDRAYVLTTEDILIYKFTSVNDVELLGQIMK